MTGDAVTTRSGNLFELSDVAIRRGRIGDAADLVRLEQAVFHLEQLTLGSFRRYLRVPGADLFVADRSGACIGYGLATYRKGSRIGRLVSLGVASAATGRGIGMALVRRLEEAALERGVSIMRLEVRRDNLSGQRLYRRAGYAQTGVQPAYYADFCDALTFEKPLVG